MYLTKIELGLTNPGIRASLRDTQRMHRLVTGFFGTQRKDGEILFCSRVRGAVVDLYLYSAQPVEPERFPPDVRLIAQRDVTRWLEEMENGTILGFQLETMPFRKTAEAGAKNSRRRALRTPQEREAWLRRKAEQSGFRILSLEEAPGEKLVARHSAENGGSLTLDSWIYTGRLCVTDAEVFRLAIRRGIGPGKAYGLGMLLLMNG